jgi:hypothetical protein
VETAPMVGPGRIYGTLHLLPDSVEHDPNACHRLRIRIENAPGRAGLRDKGGRKEKEESGQQGDENGGESPWVPLRRIHQLPTD